MDSRANKQLIAWLLSGCLLIFSMVVIGGITRLTGSGLSITEWNVVMGAVPPLNNAQWQEAFHKYQQIPQFQKVNSHFLLEDFKAIFWWEFIHRLVGRLIGVVFLLPFLYFLVKKKMDGPMIRKALFLFLLGGLQGFLGWFMVKSGLTERTSVSHIRLAIHLITAFITFAFTWYFALELMFSNREHTPRRSKFPYVFTGLVVLQIIYGALVAGMHAGKIFNTFPLMDGQVIPPDSWSSSMGFLNLLNNQVTVQLIHRMFAFALVLSAVWFWRRCATGAYSAAQRKATVIVLFALGVQFLLGVLTLLTSVNIVLASLHQAGAFFLFAAAVYLLFRFRESA